MFENETMARNSSDSRKMTLPNVKELAKRFETGARIETKPSTKRIGKFRIVENNNLQNSKVVRGCAIPRRRSSLKRRTRSIELQSTRSTTSSDVRKSKSIDNIDGEQTVLIAPRPVPRQRLPAASMIVESKKDEFPMYEERCRVSLTIPQAEMIGDTPSPPPPLPTLPPSRERLQRIPSYLKPTPAPRQHAINGTVSRPKFQSPPPPPNVIPHDASTRRPPTIPVPTPPSQTDFDDECYDEIQSCSYTPPISSEYVYESTDFTRGSRSDDVEEEEVFDEATEAEESIAVPKVKHRFLSSTLQRASRSNSKRISSMELEKLFRFKSEFQLNISKKVGQLRQKVGEKQSKRKSKCHVSIDLLDTDFSATMSRSVIDKRYDDDEQIYGDDWSSDDDDDGHDDRRSSMYRQLEEHLNKVFPDYASRSQMSNSVYESADAIFDTNDDTSRVVARPAIGHLPLDDGWNVMPDEPSPDEEEYKRQYTCRMLPNDQPLYQHYILESRGEDEADDSKQIAYEDIKDIVVAPIGSPKSATRRESSISSDSGRGADCSTTSASALTSNTSMRRERLVGASNFGSQRSLWCELAEVKAAGLLETLDDECKLRQEAYFEVITSEASYLRSLNVLITHFMANPQMLGSKSSLSVLSDSDRKHLFSNIFAVRDCSERLLCDLETRLEMNLVLDDICDILIEHFEKYFEVYIKYCSNQVYQDRTLRRLKSDSPGFLAAIQKLEEDKQCQGLDMRSFLMLPMQRITRYPLLLYAIIDRINPSDERSKTATEALTSANRVVRECNEGARRMERTEQLLEIDKRLVYKDPDLKRIPLVSNSRYLVKRGILTQLVERRTSSILQSRQKARSLHVFLFSDMIMITKKKINGTYVCKDYACRGFVDMQPIEPDNPKIPIGAISSLVGRPHLFLCTLMRNARDKQTELLLSADSESDRERWLSAVRPPTSTNPEEKIYAEWDCPQAVVVHPFKPSQADELELNVGDTINILRKIPDGWLYGERVGDNMGGWFPSSYVQNIINDHTRANNYRQRLRIIQAASGWHGNVSPSSIGRGGMPLMHRLRRMSNPKSYFQSGTIGL